MLHSMKRSKLTSKPYGAIRISQKQWVAAIALPRPIVASKPLAPILQLRAYLDSVCHQRNHTIFTEEFEHE